MNFLNFKRIRVALFNASWNLEKDFNFQTLVDFGNQWEYFQDP